MRKFQTESMVLIVACKKVKGRIERPFIFISAEKLLCRVLDLFPLGGGKIYVGSSDIFFKVLH